MGYVFSNFRNEISFREYNLSKDPLQPQVAGVIFIYLCLDLRHKQKHTADQVELHAPHHRPTQKHTANQSELTHLITEKLLQFYNTYFFLFMYRLQAQAHSGPGSSPRGSRKALFFLFIYRLQAQARPRHSDSEAGPGEAQTIFY